MENSNGTSRTRRALTGVAARVLELGMRNRIFGRCRDAYRPSNTDAAPGATSPATLRELADGQTFFDRFDGLLTPQDLRGKNILDLGSGYGGRPLFYMQHQSRSVVGVEITARMASISKSGAAAMGLSENLEFICGVGESLPFPDNQFDMVLTYDVFEHVQDLRRVLGECFRVLRPGGRVYSLFPPYFGPFAHHLDFITSLPYLHYIFPAPMLVDAANIVIDRHPELERDHLPVITNGDPLPSLNGTTERAFRQMVADGGWRIIALTPVAVGWHSHWAVKRAVNKAGQFLIDHRWLRARDLLTGTIVSILEKPNR